MPSLENARMPSLRDKQVAQEKAEIERREKERLDAIAAKKLEDGKKKKGRKTENKDE